MAVTTATLKLTSKSPLLRGKTVKQIHKLEGVIEQRLRLVLVLGAGLGVDLNITDVDFEFSQSK